MWDQVSPGSQKPWVVETCDSHHTVSQRTGFLVWDVRRCILPYFPQRVVIRIKDKGHEKTLYVSSVTGMLAICFIIFAWVGLSEIEHIQEATFWWRCYSCLVSGVLNLLVEEAQALRPHQFGFKVKLLFAVERSQANGPISLTLSFSLTK